MRSIIHLRSWLSLYGRHHRGWRFLTLRVIAFVAYEFALLAACAKRDASGIEASRVALNLVMHWPRY